MDDFVRRVKVLRVVDGDTLDVLIDLGWHVSLRERVRLLGVDAPEVRGQEREKGRWVAAMVEEWCHGRDGVFLRSEKYRPAQALAAPEKDKYGRTLGVLWDGNENLNELVKQWCQQA